MAAIQMRVTSARIAGLSPAVLSGHVLAPRLGLRSELVEVVDEHDPRPDCRARLDNVGHGRRPRGAPHPGIVGKADRQHHLRRILDGTSHRMRLKDVAMHEVYPGWKVCGPGALRDADPVSSVQ